MSRSKRLACLLLCLLLVPAAMAESESLISPDKIVTKAANYEIAVAEYGAYMREITSVASEYLPHTYEVRAGKDGMKFDELLVKKGAKVKKGDVLATFLPEVDELALAERRLKLERIREELERGRRDREETIEELAFDLAEISDRYEYELARLQIARAELELEQYICLREREIRRIEQEIADIEAELEYCTVLSPADGEIGRVAYIRKGDRVSRNEVLLTVIRYDDRMVRLENTSDRFRYGMDVEVEVGVGKTRRVLTGTVVGTDKLVPEALKDGYAYIRLDQDESGEDNFKNPKVKATGTMLGNVLLLPRKAVSQEQGRYYVSKLVDGVVHKRYVNCLLNYGEHAWVLQGVEPGEQIILD